MKRLGFLGTILSACLFFTVVCSAVAAGEHDYQQQPAKPRPGPHFTANNNGTVTDDLTGLTWLKDANCFGAQDWDVASSLSNTLADGQCGLSDGSKAGQWRLPSRGELSGLVNSQQANSSVWLNLQGFAKVQANFYWSSSSSYSSTIAWFTDMHYGGSFSSDTNFKYYIWPVRGGQ
jgi:hypothetical protein